MWTELSHVIFGQQRSLRGARRRRHSVILRWVGTVDLEVLESRTLLAPIVGDFDQNGCLNITDIDILADAVRSKSQDMTFDVDGDGHVDLYDQAAWVHDQRRTYFGDANLNGLFDSEDLAVVFLEGTYEDNVAQNATWESGDWNGDLEFSTADLVTAFQDGGYERGYRSGGEPIEWGQMVSGQFCATSWDWSAFVLKATAGQRLFLDGIEDDYDGAWLTVADPNGVQLTSQPVSYDWGPIALPESGEYQIRISTNWAGSGGDFQFRVLDVDQAAPIGVNEIYSGVLNPAEVTNLYTLSGTAGQRLYFRSLDGSGPWFWRLYGPSTNLISEFAAYDTDVILPEDGDYLISVSSYPWVDSVPFSFEFRLPATDHYDLIWDVENRRTIEQAGDWHVYSFAADAGQQVYLDDLHDQNPQGTETLVDPNGQVVYWDHNAPVTLPMSGQYQLRVSSGISNVEYRFRMLDVAAAEQIAPEQTVTGFFRPGLANQIFRIDGTAGQRVVFDPAIASQGWVWWLHGPQNEFFTGVSGPTPLDTQLTYDGQYVLVLSPEQDTEPLPYEFQVRTPGTNYQSLVLGEDVIGTIDQVGEWDVYTFDAAAGQRVFYDSLQSDFEDLQIYVSTPSSGSAWWGWSWWGNSDADSYAPITLGETGEYQVRISGSAVSSSYHFRILNVETAQQVEVGQTVSGVLSPALRVDQYRLDGIEGQHLVFNPTGGMGWSIRLSGPGNEVIADSSYIDATLPSNGEYVLTIMSNDLDSVAPYEFQINTPPTFEYPLVFDREVSGRLDIPGERDVYTFHGVTGQLLYYDALQNDMEDVWVQLLTPSGWSIWSNNADYDTFWQPISLPEDGAYRLEFSSPSNSLGYHFQLLDVASAPEIALNELVTSRIDIPDETAVYRFQGNGGTRYVFENTSTDGSAFLRLIGPQGEWLQTASDSFEYNLPYGGEYLLFVSGYSGSDLFDYSLAVRVPETNYISMDLGNEVHGAISELGQWDVYTFAGVAGQVVYLDALDPNPGTGSITLEIPGVWTTWTTSVDADGSPITLPYSGTYQLRVSGPVPSDYHFRLLDVQPAPEIAIDQTVSGTIDRPAATHLFRLPGTAGERIVIETSEPFGGTARLFGPQGEWIAESSSSFDALLPYDGEYVLAMMAVGESVPVSYEFRVRSALTNTFPLAMGEEVTGSIDETGQWDVYHFEGTTGQLIYYDALQNDFEPVYVELSTPSGWQVWWANADQDSGYPILLPESGVFQLRVSGANGLSGYRFRILDLATAEEIVPGDLITGATSPIQQAVMYRVKLSGGQLVAFNQLSGSIPLNYSLIDPVSNWLVQAGVENMEFRAGYDQDYLLLIQGDGFTESSFELQTAVVESALTPAIIG